MISFKEYMELLEAKSQPQEGLDAVPRGAMKVSTRATDLPDNPPYGFWVDRSGNFKVVPFMGHTDAAMDIIHRANVYLKKKGAAPIKIEDYSNDPYDRLFENGWLRVVVRSGSREIYYNSMRGEQATQSQMKFLNFIKDLYDMERVELRF